MGHRHLKEPLREWGSVGLHLRRLGRAQRNCPAQASRLPVPLLSTASLGDVRWARVQVLPLAGSGLLSPGQASRGRQDPWTPPRPVRACLLPTLSVVSLLSSRLCPVCTLPVGLPLRLRPGPPLPWGPAPPLLPSGRVPRLLCRGEQAFAPRHRSLHAEKLWFLAGPQEADNKGDMPRPIPFVLEHSKLQQGQGVQQLVATADSRA